MKYSPGNVVELLFPLDVEEIVVRIKDGAKDVDVGGGVDVTVVDGTVVVGGGGG